jgi:Holliday junction resolvasome RuvABC ATP-dependent DNA helicase subunit
MLIGQSRIQKELEYILPNIQSGKNVNILLSAPSGHGKTTLAYHILNQLGFNQSQISGPPDFLFDRGIRFHFIDEIHELERPEVLYPILDGGQYTMIIATNELGDLKEPLVNRCIPMMFAPYTELELAQIAGTVLYRWQLSDDKLYGIVRKGKGNPRVVKNICQRLDNVFPYSMPRTEAELDDICEEILGISPDGLTEIDRKYISFLRTVGGSASLDLISNSLHLSVATLKREVEPHLVYLGLLQITSRGRNLV